MNTTAQKMRNLSSWFGLNGAKTTLNPQGISNAVNACFDAADEIEKLRAALQAVTSAWPDADSMSAIARAALANEQNA
jgi:hypothetical protein